MDRQAALHRFGLPEGSSKELIHSVHSAQRAEAEARLERASLPKLEAQYRAAIEELDMALSVLNSHNNQEFHNLSATKIADLPIAQPSASGTATPSLDGHSPTSLRVGNVLAQRYELKERIGVGGMGEVFRAQDRTRGEDIAIKVLLPHLLQHPVALERFAAEAKISIDLAHPSIVNVFDLQREGDYTFLTMELLQGQTLRQQMQARERSHAPFTVAEALELAQEVGHALDYAHKRTVHRDVKPENIWVNADSHEGSHYKLMDFGIARLTSNSQLNQTRTAMGTAYYMAPEQLIGGVEVDGRADQFALAVLLYELLAGEKPVGRSKSLHERNPKIPKAFSLAVDRALSQRPHERFPTMVAFVQALQSKLGGASAKHLWWGAGAGAAAVIALAATFSTWSQWVPVPGRSAETRSQAIQAQGIAESLLKRIEAREREIDTSVREARSQVDRIESSQRMARSDGERRELAGRLITAQRTLQQWEEIKALAGTVVYGTESLGRLRGQINIGTALMRENHPQQAAQEMLAAQHEAERLLSLPTQISEAIEARMKFESLVVAVKDFARSERTDLGVATLEAALQRASHQIELGQFDAAKKTLTDTRVQHGLTVKGQIDQLFTRYTKLAERAAEVGDFTTAEQALSQARRLEGLGP